MFERRGSEEESLDYNSFVNLLLDEMREETATSKLGKAYSHWRETISNRLSYDRCTHDIVTALSSAVITDPVIQKISDIAHNLKKMSTLAAVLIMHRSNSMRVFDNDFPRTCSAGKPLSFWLLQKPHRKLRSGSHHRFEWRPPSCLNYNWQICCVNF